MATRRWQGGAIAVAEVQTVQVTAYHASTTYTLTVGTASVSTIAQGSVNATATALATAWNNSTAPQLTEITALASTDTVTLTHDDPGVSFTVTPSVAGGTGTLGSATVTTAGAGPNHWNTATNWSGGAVPVDSDDVYLDYSDDDIKYGLDQSSVQPATLTIAASFTGTIGLPEVNSDSTEEYYEYRDQYLKIGPTTLDVGAGAGQGSGRVKINTGTDQVTGVLRASSSGEDSNLEAVLWKGTNASNVWTIIDGSFGAAVFGGETAVVATLNVQGGSVRCGAGVTLTTVNANGGDVETASAVTTLTVDGGATVTHRAGAVTTANVRDGTLDYRSTGTLTTLVVDGGGTADFSNDPRAKTITNADVFQGGSFLDPLKVTTLSNGLDLNRCGLDDVTIQLGQNVRLTIGVPS